MISHRIVQWPVATVLAAADKPDKDKNGFLTDKHDKDKTGFLADKHDKDENGFLTDNPDKDEHVIDNRDGHENMK